MANQVNVLVVVDVEGALASGDLGSNVYLVDTNKFFGSYGEGQEELVTSCKDGQIVTWSVTPINSGDDAEITGFNGQIINQKICQPQPITPVPGVQAWSGRVESQGATGSYQYTCTLSFDGREMSFDPFLQVKA
ncbi:alpha-pore-forming tripartite toxin MakABE regulator [Pseudomonas viridiflava]|uniref:alpha-pore-forming tripartite toxin MakABE regulator n=1 Tax=Pseudomonas viridiflava TaxID=33069 RepID=UPI000F014511|nr:hypothetical protein [Pseudomonas viridiflava]